MGDVSLITNKGLPQVSYLSPILFNFYTKIFHELTSDKVQIGQYADDFTYIINCDTKYELVQLTQVIFARIIDITDRIELPINTDKSCIMSMFTKKPMLNEVKHSLKILGVYYDKNWKF